MAAPADPPTVPLRRERMAILAGLLLLAAVAWVSLIAQAGHAGQSLTGLTMGMGAAVFFATWLVMMVAMMFPTAAPMIVMFHRIHAERRRRGQSFVPTGIFVGAYLAIWLGAGVIAYTAAVTADMIAIARPEFLDRAALIGGVAVILVGLYQLSPMKRRCLTKCRSPLSFLLGSWRDGTVGAMRMGVEHGAYCLGCCWLLFVLLFPLGIMNVAAMAAITALIFAEKSLPFGQRIGQVAAVGLVAYGAVVIAVPAALPTAMPAMTHETTPREPMPAMPGAGMPGM